MSRHLRFTVIALVLFLAPLSGVVSGSEESSSEPRQASIAQGGGCTSFCLRNNDYAVFGTNLDNIGFCEGLIHINPRGLLKTGFQRGTTGANISWVSKYASISFNVACYQTTWSGMNERGLMVSAMGLYESTVCPDPDERPTMGGGFAMQYILDTCETIDEVIATEQKIRITTRDHYLISDRFGNCATMEFLEGEMVIHTGEDLPVAALGNNEYSVVVESWLNGWSMDNDVSYKYFYWAADRVEAFRSMDEDAAIDYAFETLDILQHLTEWSIVYDAKNLRAYFKTYFNSQIRYVDLHDFCLSCNAPVQMLEMNGALAGDASGDVSAYFVDFSYEINYEHALRYYTNNFKSISTDALAYRIHFFENVPCVDKDTAENIFVSDDLPGWNADPRFAINTNTGDILVVWNQLDADDQSSSVVRSAMLMRSLAGRYSSAEAQLLSDEDSYSARPFPIFLEKQNRFLVVWDQADPAAPQAESDILGRIVLANGLPEGEIFGVVSNGERNESPHVYARTARSGSAGLAASKAKLILLFNTVMLDDNKVRKSGLYLARLNRRFRAGRRRLLMRGGAVNVDGTNIPQRILPSGVGQMVDQTLFLPVVHETVQEDGFVLDRPKIIVVDRTNSLAACEDLGRDFDTRPNLAVFENSQGDTVVIASTIRDGRVVNSVMEYTASAQPPVLTPLFESTEKKKSIDSLLIVLAPAATEQEGGSAPIAYKAVGYQFSAATDGSVYRRKLEENGRTVGPLKSVFEHDEALRAMSGVEILFADQAGNAIKGEKAELLIVWQKMITRSESEVRAHFLEVRR